MHDRNYVSFDVNDIVTARICDTIFYPILSKYLTNLFALNDELKYEYNLFNSQQKITLARLRSCLNLKRTSSKFWPIDILLVNFSRQTVIFDSINRILYQSHVETSYFWMVNEQCELTHKIPFVGFNGAFGYVDPFNIAKWQRQYGCC